MQHNNNYRAVLAADLISIERSCNLTAWILKHVNIVAVDDARLKQIAVSGTTIVVPAALYLNRPLQERITMLCQAAWHIALQHDERAKGKEEDIWRLATEHESNDILMYRGFILPKGFTFFPEMAGHTAEEVYDYLLQQTGTPMKGGTNGILSGSAAAAANQAIGQKVDGMGGMPGEDDDEKIECDMAEIFFHIAGSLGEGILPGSMPDVLQKIFNNTDKSKTDWVEALRDFIITFQKAGYRWFPPNRRYISQHKYLPSRSRKPVLEINLAIDTSGSCQDYLPVFLAEFIAIVEVFASYKIKVFQCDAALSGNPVTYTEYEPLDPTKFTFTGGGGTDFRPVFEKIDADIESNGEEPLPLIYLTDGDGDAPAKEPDYPVLWAIIGGGKKPSDWGLEIQIAKGR